MEIFEPRGNGSVICKHCVCAVMGEYAHIIVGVLVSMVKSVISIILDQDKHLLFLQLFVFRKYLEMCKYGGLPRHRKKS